MQRGELTVNPLRLVIRVMQAVYLLIQKSTLMYPEGMALENTLLLVVYFQTRHRKRLLYSFIDPCSLAEHMGREGGVVLINGKWLSICLYTVKSIWSLLFLFACFGASRVLQ